MEPNPNEWLKIPDIVEQYPISKATIYRYIKAREFEQRIAAGEKVSPPKDVAIYIGYGFPLPEEFGPRNKSWRRCTIDAWISSRAANDGSI